MKTKLQITTLFSIAVLSAAGVSAQVQQGGDQGGYVEMPSMPMRETKAEKRPVSSSWWTQLSYSVLDVPAIPGTLVDVTGNAWGDEFLAITRDDDDFLGVTSGNVNNYHFYSLDSSYLADGWQPSGSLSGMTVCRLIPYSYPDGFLVAGYDASYQPMIAVTSDEGATWNSYAPIPNPFLAVCSDGATVRDLGGYQSECHVLKVAAGARATDVANFIAIGSDDALSSLTVFATPATNDRTKFIAIGSNVFKQKAYNFIKVGSDATPIAVKRTNNSNSFLAIGSNGETYTAPFPLNNK